MICVCMWLTDARVCTSLVLCVPVGDVRDWWVLCSRQDVSDWWVLCVNISGVVLV